MSEHPAICLNMIVRNEMHIVREVLDAAAPHIAYWVVIDTGSDDGTQDVIRNHMASLNIPGELYERPWRNFGHNRTEALSLAQGHGDYIWVIDADDTVVGGLDLTHLTADVYLLRCKDQNGDSYWQPWLFRDGVRVQWVGVTHEYAVWDYDSCDAARLGGEYHIDIRNIGARNVAGQKLPNDRDLLLAEVERNPEDSRSVFYLAATYYAMSDFDNARKWYARRAQMGGWDEEVYFALWRVAQSMARLREPWPAIQDAYLRTWEFRPTRAEPLYAVGRHYREDHRYRLGYLFAQRAVEIPFPEQDAIAVAADVYTWRAKDEQAVCASWIGRQPEAFTLCRQLIEQPDVPDQDRQRITGNRDVCVPTMIEAASHYPEAKVQTLLAKPQGEVMVSLIAGPHRHTTELTLNSFLHCCNDLPQASGFVAFDTGLSEQDRIELQERYGFLEFIDIHPHAELNDLRAHILGRFWLHLAEGWRFFAPDSLLTRLAAVLEAEPDVFQVGVNLNDATKLTGACAPEHEVRRTFNAGRYLVTDTTAHGPAMFDTTRLDRAPRTATLDEVLCIST
ncbi:glycosyltransferase [Mycobacterium asiaticum]|uniref:Glycosyl transferase n=1 Tax=Mycobacterium asiaticum TaxID=1790 RepID=A0A1A3ND59_MYCAS|nr:glycosyltransferase [Mycobacterium asiaticum]OBK19235.1 glycosyl transferase [Mycobacterium asiaticum]